MQVVRKKRCYQRNRIELEVYKDYLRLLTWILQQRRMVHMGNNDFDERAGEPDPSLEELLDRYAGPKTQKAFPKFFGSEPLDALRERYSSPTDDETIFRLDQRILDKASLNRPIGDGAITSQSVDVVAVMQAAKLRNLIGELKASEDDRLKGWLTREREEAFLETLEGTSQQIQQAIREIQDRQYLVAEIDRLKSSGQLYFAPNRDLGIDFGKISEEKIYYQNYKEDEITRREPTLPRLQTVGEWVTGNEVRLLEMEDTLGAISELDRVAGKTISYADIRGVLQGDGPLFENGLDGTSRSELILSPLENITKRLD